MKILHLLLRLWGKLTLVALCGILTVALSSQPAWAYNPPDKAAQSVSGTRYNLMAEVNHVLGYTDQKTKYEAMFPLTPTGSQDYRDNSNKLNAHGTITLGAIQVLRGDGKNAIANDMMNNMGWLIDGSMQGDTAGGQFTLGAVGLGSYELNRSSFGHFYNYSDIRSPDQNPSGSGFIYDDAGGVKGLVISVSESTTMPWEVFTLKGPQTPLTEVANIEYAKAVDFKRRAQKSVFNSELCVSAQDCNNKAYQALGRVLHLIQDSTIPQHATNEGSQEDNAWHTGYEDGVDAFLDKGWISHATSGGLYNLGKPERYALKGTEIASGSTPWDSSRSYLDFAAYKDGGYELRPVPPSGAEDNYYKDIMSGTLTANSIVVSRNLKAARDLVPLAERLSAGILDRFYNNWASEQFQVAIVDYQRATDLDKSADYLSGADMYIKWRWSGESNWRKTYPISGSDDINPNALSPYNWYFVKWLNSPSDALQFDVQLWDYDQPDPDDWYDLCPQSNLGTATVTQNPPSSTNPQGVITVCNGAKIFNKDNQPSMRPFSAEFSTWGQDGDRGYVRARIYRYPTEPVVVVQPSTPTPTPVTEKCFNDLGKPIPCDP